MTVPDIAFDTYYDYETMTRHLQALASSSPNLAKLTSKAKSFQGRDVWMMEITNSETGPALSKPGYYLDAQIHAEEHAGSATALYAIWYLLSNYGKDDNVTRLIDRQAIYVWPRINPDGAEIALKPPYFLWCGNGRFQPGLERIEGLIQEDVDGDGFITSMRVPDPKGEWKKSARDPRLMVQREPGEEGGEYFRLYPEGRIRNYDGLHVKIERPFDGNMNRNFPINWSPREYGAGEHPLSEPEAMAMGRFILDHPNIAGVCAYHTHGGIILRPSMTKPDAAMGARDLALYKDLGAVATRLTGYPTISTYEDFTPDKTKPRYGSLKDWTYEEMGIVSFSPELWDLETEAGVEKVAYYNLRPRTEEIQAKVFEWILANVGDMGWRDWKKVDHPELGPVEVGGMVYTWTYRNPPPRMLKALCHKAAMFNLRHAAAAPWVRVDGGTAEHLGADLWRVRAVVSNHGYLPTNLSDVAIRNETAKTVKLTIAAGAGAEVIMNPATVDLGHLAGRNERKYAWSPWGEQWSPVTKAGEWLVRGPRGAEVTLTALSEKGGTHALRVTLS